MPPDKLWRVIILFSKGVGCGFVVNEKRHMIAEYMF